MSAQRRSAPPSPPQQSPQQDLKLRVINCLNKLADRDTYTLATAELEAIAKNLTTQDTFTQFLNCIHNTDSSTKSLVRKQCVNLLTVLSRHHDGDTLCPHVSKMISTVIRRLRDQDSAVRAACVASVSEISSNVPFTLVCKPLMEMLFTEQEYNSQIGAAMCLAAAIDAAEEADVDRLSKALPKMVKLVKREGFKAKAAVIGVIGSVIGAGGAANGAILEMLVPFLVELLSSEDWMSRKAAAEGLQKLAVTVDKDFGNKYRKTCLSVLETRRFDKVKIVRETMNHSLQMWKEVPDESEEVSAPSPARSVSSSSSSIGKKNPSFLAPDNGNIGCCPPLMKSAHDIGFITPRTKRRVPVPTSRSTAPKCSLVTPARKESSLKNNDRNMRISQMNIRQDEKKSPDWKVEIVVPHSGGDQLKESDSVSSLGEKEESGYSRPRTKRALFGRVRNEKKHIFGGSRSASCVVPLPDDETLDSVVDNDAEEVYNDNYKDVEDLSLIQEQLRQIENQQSNLLDLLQKFMGSSQIGINSLETRVQGIEKALDEISYDLGLSGGRWVPNMDSAENSCYKLTGAEFLSPTYWRRTDARFSNPKVSTAEIYSQKFQQQSRAGFYSDPLADIDNYYDDLPGSSGSYRNAMPRNIIQDARRIKYCDMRNINIDSSSTCTARV
ncbi:hypothetical protein ACFE04_025031 [Oxalis oulophora]